MKFLELKEFRVCRHIRRIVLDIVVNRQCVVKNLLLVEALIIHRRVFLVDLVHLATV